MAKTFSQKMDAALAGMVTGQKAAVKSAFTTVQTALAAEETTYGSPKPETIWLDETLVRMASELRCQMR